MNENRNISKIWRLKYSNFPIAVTNVFQMQLKMFYTKFIVNIKNTPKEKEKIKILNKTT